MREKKLLTKEDLQAMLPKVGDHLLRVPVVHGLNKIDQAGKPQFCTVVKVNREHLWYRVQFEAGYSVCYKVPGRGDA